MKRRLGRFGSWGVAGLLGVLGAASCGGGGKTSYEYTFSETGCATGDMTFTSLAAMCTSLQSDSVNANCALTARMTFFTQHCTGAFVEAP
jgi:hypothetical protein